MLRFDAIAKRLWRSLVLSKARRSNFSGVLKCHCDMSCPWYSWDVNVILRNSLVFFPWPFSVWHVLCKVSPQSPQTPVIRTTTPRHPRLRTWRWFDNDYFVKFCSVFGKNLWPWFGLRGRLERHTEPKQIALALPLWVNELLQKCQAFLQELWQTTSSGEMSHFMISRQQASISTALGCSALANVKANTLIDILPMVMVALKGNQVT